MASEMTMAGTRLGREPFWRGDAAVAILSAVLVGVVAAVAGFKGLEGTADNDSLLRLVQVRDLIGGQQWFDLHQYRMGVEGGLLMHWSRLVDAPIAAIVVAATAVTGSQAAGETIALIAWPLALYAAAFYLLLRIGRVVGGQDAMLPLTVIGAITLYFIGILKPGAIDHHNVQLVLMLAMVLFLLRAETGGAAAWLAGAAAVLMLAVGMETAPYVAAGGLFVAFRLLSGEDGARRAAVGFGSAFAATSAAVFLATVPKAQWTTAYCDAYSVAQLAAGMAAGAGLAAVAAWPVLNGSLARRVAALAVLGGAVAALAAVYFPQCLSDPYADLAPMLRSYWLDLVGEAQPLWTILALEPEAAAGQYATVLIALVVLGLRIRKNGLRSEEVLLGVMLATALLVSIWQVRGARFSLPLACVPLAMWVGDLRRRAQAAPGRAASLKLAGAWLVSLHLIWMVASLGVWRLVGDADPEQELAKQTCYDPADFADLATLPPTEVLTISNLGAPILRYTHHSVLAGPYHRNVAGNLAVLEALIGSPGKAREVTRMHGVGLVALCRGNNETAILARRAPDGLLADLLAGRPPGWLRPVAGTAGKPLELYSVSPAQE